MTVQQQLIQPVSPVTVAETAKISDSMIMLLKNRCLNHLKTSYHLGYPQKMWTNERVQGHSVSHRKNSAVSIRTPWRFDGEFDPSGCGSR